MKNIPLPHMSSLVFTLSLALSMASAVFAEVHPRDRIRTENDLILFEAPEVPEAWRNPALPANEERAYWERANHVMRVFEGQIDVHTEGEREKSSYPITMFNYLLGSHEEVMREMQKEDNQAGTDHAWTKGIDYYWGFTLKGQMRKYFLLGPDMDPEYRQRMFDGAKIWTAEDPRPSFELVNSLRSDDEMVREYALQLLNTFRGNIAELPDDAIAGTVRDQYAGEDLGDDLEQWMAWWKQYADQGWQVYEDLERLANPYPHPRYGVGTGPVGAQWDPGVRGMRADARNTDNLRAMRDISVYLMAEETGNERVRRLYKDKIQSFVVNLYRYHHGEWDSENYLHHTIAPYHNLYDFAKDEEVVALAKAALDYMYTSAAVKYYRGTSVAPTKRTGGGLERHVWLYFGDRPEPEPRPYYDLFHSVTSGYRPPLATIHIGRGEFDRPAEMINSKPTYSFWLPGQGERPETWETVFYGGSYYLGSAVSLSPQGDVRAFEMQMDTDKGWSRAFLANSGNNFNGLRAGDQIGQYRNAVVWLRRDDNARFSFQLPGEADVTIENGVWFVSHDKTYLAIYPLNLNEDAIDPVASADDGNVRFNAQQTGGNFAGFALLAGDASEFGNFADFQAKVKSDANLDRANLNEGQIQLKAVEGHVLGYTWQADDRRPRIERDGEHYDWDENFHVYRPMDDNAPIRVDWNGGTLSVNAGGASFEQTVHEDGTVEFEANP
ncbi:MAG: hypothetical protein JJU29_08810 [Verrucomicrobia bacterium]|nr:hypothetical protein [Verrucomicrobiota bacterium]MCH8511265.1 hypothetical protein [Kiritimatiellia bacterium]